MRIAALLLILLCGHPTHSKAERAVHLCSVSYHATDIHQPLQTSALFTLVAQTADARGESAGTDKISEAHRRAAGGIARQRAANEADFRLTAVLKNEATDRVFLIAHRGGVVDEQRIENSLPAIEEAVRRGYHMLEVDIRETKDGHLVVHHDEDFRRFFGDDRRVADMTWAEIQQLRSKPGKLRPIDFAEYAKACKGRIRLMLDVKPPMHSKSFFAELRRILQENQLLDSAFAIGTDQAKQYLKGKSKVAVDAKGLTVAIKAGERVDRLYFLFQHGDMKASTIQLAQENRVTVVPSVNVFHYPPASHRQRATADIRRLRKLGVKYFQVDSVYEEIFGAKVVR